MKTLFIAGKPNAGKTSVCLKLAKRITRSFKLGKPKVFKNPEDSEDKIFVYPCEISGQKKKRLIINTASDTKKIINFFLDKLKEIGDKIGFGNLILITAIRYEEDDKPRDWLLSGLEEIDSNLLKQENYLEYPISRFSVRNEIERDAEIDEWTERVTDVLIHILSKEPFNLL